MGLEFLGLRFFWVSIVLGKDFFVFRFFGSEFFFFRFFIFTIPIRCSHGLQDSFNLTNNNLRNFKYFVLNTFLMSDIFGTANLKSNKFSHNVQKCNWWVNFRMYIIFTRFELYNKSLVMSFIALLVDLDLLGVGMS